MFLNKFVDIEMLINGIKSPVRVELGGSNEEDIHAKRAWDNDGVEIHQSLLDNQTVLTALFGALEEEAENDY